MSNITNKLPKEFFKQFKSREEFQSFFNDLFKEGIQEMLKGELDEHLGYEKHHPAGYNSGNSRNGSYPKTVKTENLGDIVLNIPRDRNGDFQPQLVPKGQRMSQKLEESILSMYGRGMTTADISGHVKEIYGVSVSAGTISNVTNKITDHIREWQDRPLEPVYFMVWMDGVVMKVRQNGKVINKCIYLVLGLKKDGTKEILGMWIAENESAAFWLSVLTDLKARGVEDVLIACTDNLKGFTQAIQAAFPAAITQICVIHQIRNSCRFVVKKDRKDFCAALKEVYAATNRDCAEQALDRLDEKWEKKYRYAVNSWRTNWDNLSAYFDYPMEMRKIMYTTNTIENLNRVIRKYTKTKVQFVDDNAAQKATYLALMNMQEKWTRPIRNWGLIMQQYLTIFGDRCRLN